MAGEQHGSSSHSDSASRGSNLVTLSCHNHRQTIMNGLWDSFTKQSSAVDFNIQLGGRSIGAHHFLLEMFLSPHRLLTLGQTVSDQADAVRLGSLLHFLYRGTVAVHEEELERLLALAKQLNFQAFVDAAQGTTKRGGGGGDDAGAGLLVPKTEVVDEEDRESSCASPGDQSGLNNTAHEDVLRPIVQMLEYGEAIEHDALEESCDFEMRVGLTDSSSSEDDLECTCADRRGCSELASPPKKRKNLGVLLQPYGQSVFRSTFPDVDLRNYRKSKAADNENFVTMRDFKKFQKEFREFKESTVMRMGKISQACSAHSGVIFDREMTEAEEQLDSFCLPVNTVERFDELNAWAVSEDNKNLMVSKLSKIGGNNLDALTRELLKRIIGRDLCEMLTFTGKFGQVAFKGTSMYDLVLGIVTSSELGLNATFRQIDEIIIRWINGAKDRNRGRVKRKHGVPVFPSPAPQLYNLIQPDASVVSKPLDYFCLPLHTMESFEELNLWVSDAHNKTALFNVLSRIGGASPKRITKAVLTKVFGNDLCENFNFTGKLGKRAMKDTKIYDLIVETILYHAISKDFTFRQIDVIIMRWLNGAKDRNGGRVKRKSTVETASENDNDEPDERDASIALEQPLDYFSLPIDNLESFVQLLGWLTDRNNQEALIARLAALGGHDTDTITSEILASLLTSDLCHHLTFSGKFGKQGIKGTTLYDVILETIYRREVAQEATHRDIDKIIMRWINGARGHDTSERIATMET